MVRESVGTEPCSKGGRTFREVREDTESSQESLKEDPLQNELNGSDPTHMGPVGLV